MGKAFFGLAGCLAVVVAAVVAFRRLFGLMDERAVDDAAWRAEDRPISKGPGGRE